MTTIEKHWKFDYTDVLFWLGILMLTAWIIGKLTGLIQSPVWIEQFPFIAALITILSIGLKAGRILQKLDYVIDAVGKLSDNVKEHEKDIITIKHEISELKKKLSVA
ncbi:hypothetical protein ig2599ANME_0324 [groundwater metagenome]